ncbi:MAG: acyloxyacyl hydrolase [Flavisolibacter sp.]
MKRVLLHMLALLFVLTVKAQDNRAQYPLLLQKAYFGVDFGAIHYPFSQQSLPPGYQAQNIEIPAAAPRLTLLGYHFTKNLSARITYMRPVQWVLFKNINGDQLKHSVWMNVGGLTVKQNVPLSSKLSVYGEAGLALITRNGFSIHGSPVVSDASYSTISVGGGLEYRLNSKWNLDIYSSYSPGKTSIKEPATTFTGVGFSYNMHPLSAETVAKNGNDGFSFPRQVVQFAFTTNALGYGVNHFFAEGKVPVFWGGLAQVEQGLAINYTRNVFHTRKTFSLDVGASFGSWESRAKEESFQSISVYPVLRFTVVHSKIADGYFFYSVAGPTFISRTTIDNQDTGKHFTFRDFMGIGSYIGNRKAINFEMNIGHFSNGNIFPNNGAVKIPLSFVIGYSL